MERRVEPLPQAQIKKSLWMKQISRTTAATLAFGNRRVGEVVVNKLPKAEVEEVEAGGVALLRRVDGGADEACAGQRLPVTGQAEGHHPCGSHVPMPKLMSSLKHL